MISFEMLTVDDWLVAILRVFCNDFLWLLTVYMCSDSHMEKACNVFRSVRLLDYQSKLQ
jgi:hypothetical protein